MWYVLYRLSGARPQKNTQTSDSESLLFDDAAVPLTDAGSEKYAQMLGVLPIRRLASRVVGKEAVLLVHAVGGPMAVEDAPEHRLASPIGRRGPPRHALHMLQAS